jgi:hypothetical protein
VQGFRLSFSPLSIAPLDGLCNTDTKFKKPLKFRVESTLKVRTCIMSSMTCIKPTKFKTSTTHVRCGSCIPCRVVRKQEWLTKLTLEAKNHAENGLFLTLTYTDDLLPDRSRFNGGTLVKKDMQDFMKRLRKFTGKKGIRYFLVGEYGEKSQRAHYHVVLFNVEYSEIKSDFKNYDMYKTSKIQECKTLWKYGYVHIGDLNSNTISYTLGYTLKKLTSQKDFKDGRQPEFTLMSKNPTLGSWKLPDIAKTLKEQNVYPSGYLDTVEKFILETRGIFQPTWDGKISEDTNFQYPTEWNGWFDMGDKTRDNKRRKYKLDSYMMKLLAKEFDDEWLKDIRHSADTIRNNLPSEYYEYCDNLLKKSQSDKIVYISSPEYIQDVKKSEKIERQHVQRRKI